MDYYTILGLDRNASTEEIKKAYKKMATLHHPDKHGGDETKFVQIKEAYSVLIDEKRRQIYDRYGLDGLHQYDNNPFAQAQAQPRLAPLVVQVKCDLGQLYQGATIEVNVKRTILNGDIKQPHQLTQTHEKEKITLKIEPFTIYGQKIVQKDKGNRHQTDPDLISDLIFVIVPKYPKSSTTPNQFNPFGQFSSKKSVDSDTESDTESDQDDVTDPYQNYTLDNYDLHYQLKLSLIEALIGFSHKIEFLDGQIGLITSENITKPGTIKIIEGHGFNKKTMTQFGPVDHKGKIYVHCDVEFPEKLTPNQKRQLASLFGSKPKQSEHHGLHFKFENLNDYNQDDEEPQPQTIFINQSDGQPNSCSPM